MRRGLPNRVGAHRSLIGHVFAIASLKLPARAPRADVPSAIKEEKKKEGSTVFAKHVFEGAADHGDISLDEKRVAVGTGDFDPLVVVFLGGGVLERESAFEFDGLCVRSYVQHLDIVRHY